MNPARALMTKALWVTIIALAAQQAFGLGGPASTLLHGLPFGGGVELALLATWLLLPGQTVRTHDVVRSQ